MCDGNGEGVCGEGSGDDGGGLARGVSGMAEIVTSVLKGAERAAARAMAMGRVAGGEKCRDERW